MLEEGSRIPVEACSWRVNHGSKCQAISELVTRPPACCSPEASVLCTLRSFKQSLIIEYQGTIEAKAESQESSLESLPKHVPISTGARIVAAAKAKLRAAVISDEMRKSILSNRLSHLFLLVLLSSGIWRTWGEHNDSKEGLPYFHGVKES